MATDTEMMNYFIAKRGILHCVWQVSDGVWKVYLDTRPDIDTRHADLRVAVAAYMALDAEPPARRSLL